MYFRVQLTLNFNHNPFNKLDWKIYKLKKMFLPTFLCSVWWFPFTIWELLWEMNFYCLNMNENWKCTMTRPNVLTYSLFIFRLYIIFNEFNLNLLPKLELEEMKKNFLFQTKYKLFAPFILLELPAQSDWTQFHEKAFVFFIIII